MIGDLLGQLKKILSHVDEESEICYRGFGDKEWLDNPALFRENRIPKEKNTIEETIRHFPDEFAGAHTIDVLTQMQHYECPTRMMDVTTNFLVSLFFACGGWDKALGRCLPDVDGCVRIYTVPNAKVKSIDSETVTVIANISRLKDGDMFGQLPWICEKDWGVWQSDDDLILQNAEDANSVVLVKTRLNNPRVRAQSGAFFIFGGLEGIENISCPKCLREAKVKKKKIEFPKEYLLGEISVKSNWKEMILEDLGKYCNISYPVLCPEKQDFIKTLML